MNKIQITTKVLLSVVIKLTFISKRCLDNFLPSFPLRIIFRLEWVEETPNSKLILNTKREKISSLDSKSITHFSILSHMGLGDVCVVRPWSLQNNLIMSYHSFCSVFIFIILKILWVLRVWVISGISDSAFLRKEVYFGWRKF